VCTGVLPRSELEPGHVEGGIRTSWREGNRGVFFKPPSLPGKGVLGLGPQVTNQGVTNHKEAFRKLHAECPATARMLALLPVLLTNVGVSKRILAVRLLLKGAEIIEHKVEWKAR
jgi:hypothetical protein